MNHVRAPLIGLALAAWSLSACGSEAEGQLGPAEGVTVVGEETPSASNESATDVVEPTVVAEREASPSSSPVAESEEPADNQGSATEPSAVLVGEIEPMEAIEGGNVGRVYSASEAPSNVAGLVEIIVNDVATRLKQPAELVNIVAIAEVTWADGSLGCPRDGFAYTQALTEGWRLVVQANSVVFDYRTSGVDTWFLCSQAVVTNKSSAGLYELTEDGVVQLEPPVYDDELPTEGTNPPDK